MSEKAKAKTKKKTKEQLEAESSIKMSQTPIAVKSRQLLTIANEITAKVPQAIKYTFGSTFSTLSCELAFIVYDALAVSGQTQEKIDKIDLLRPQIHKCLCYIAVLKDINGVSRDLFESYVSTIASIKIQAENWKKSIEKIINPENNQEEPNDQ